MDSVRKEFYRFIAGFIALLCVACIVLSVWAVRNAVSIHAEETRKQVLEVKKQFLFDTVQNVVRDINSYRRLYRGDAEKQERLLAVFLSVVERSSSENFSMFVTKFLNTDDISLFWITLEHKKSGRRIDNRPRGTLNTGVSKPDTPSGYPPSLTFNNPVNTYDCGEWTLFIQIRQEWIDNKTKEAIRNSIHGKKFENDAYIWVNEIVDYNGGTQYAIRRIHPNLRDTEGSFLSTESQDIKGNFPYKTELEGVKEHGDVFQTYWFKRKDSGKIAEKLSYAYLYPDYHWIIAMGIHLEDLQAYVDDANKTSKELIAQVTSTSIITLLIIFLVWAVTMAFVETRYVKRIAQQLSEESNKDALTGVFNRKLGDPWLADAFKRFKKGLFKPALLFIDIDDFKKVNDTLGHEIGDEVLKAMARMVSQSLRTSDMMFRWGGEEFLVCAEGITPGNALSFGWKLNQLIAHNPVPSNNGTNAMLQITVSIGIAWFSHEDRSEADALKRADQAMYKAKEAGKNCTRMGI